MSRIITYNNCLCCGSASISNVFSCKDYTVSHEDYEVWKCNNCSFRFTQNVPSEESIYPYYKSSAYVSHSDTKKGLVNRLYHIVRSYTLQAKARLVQRATGIKTGVLLDVGAGTGAFSYNMQKAGWNVTGLEPDDVAKAKASDAYHLDLKESKELYSLPAAHYDAITLWHVLEHVHDLHGYLEKFAEIIKPAGRLIIAVPNYCSYDAQTYKQYWAAYDVPRHLYHFSPQSMEVLLQRKGFSLKQVKPMWFDSFYVSMLSEKYKTGRNNFIRAVWVGLISNIKALSDRKRCSSVIYIAAASNSPEGGGKKAGFN